MTVPIRPPVSVARRPRRRGRGAYDQPVRFGVLGDLSDFLGRMREVVIVDRRADSPKIGSVHKGRSTFDRPDIDELLAELDALRKSE